MFNLGAPPSNVFNPGLPPSQTFNPGMMSASGLSAPPPVSGQANLPPVGPTSSSSAFPPPSNSFSAANPPPLMFPPAPTASNPLMPPPPAPSGLPPVGSRLSRPPSAQSLGGTGSVTPGPPSVQGSDSGVQTAWDTQSLLPASGAQSQPPLPALSPAPPSGTFSPPHAMNPTSPSPSLPPLSSGGAVKTPEPAVAREAVEQPQGPIPDEHKELVDVLEKLRSECYNVAGLPQIKRKLEDVARKLEIMREKLKEGSLSASTLNSLHNIVNALKNRDYQLALSIHTQLVTAGNFAEISSFLPSIKVLIQSAASLNVFL